MLYRAKINPCFYLDLQNGNISSRDEWTADLKLWRYSLSGLIAQRFGETFPFGTAMGVRKPQPRSWKLRLLKINQPFGNDNRVIWLNDRILISSPLFDD
jgi:hypothetical protein